MKITNKQLIVLDYIKQFISEKGYSPTVREICTGLGLKSPATVQEHLKKLTLAGIITNNPKKSRTIELLVENEYLKEDENVVLLPLYESLESILVPKFMISNYNKKNLFVYKDLNDYYIINKALTPFKDSICLCSNNDHMIVTSNYHDLEIIGVVISQIKMFI